MSDSLVADLGIGPEVWLFLSLMGCVTLFFKFSRIWSVRNLDLLLIFALAPGLMMVVGHGGRVGVKQPWVAFALLFLGSGLWLIRCLIDLGLTRRPLLEPNLNAAGLTCLAIGMLGLLLAETVSLPVGEGAQRNPAEPAGRPGDAPPMGSETASSTVNQVLQHAPIPAMLKPNPPQVILARVLAALSHLGLVAGLIAVGWRQFDRPIAGLAMAACYLLLPYTRMALVDSGQLFPAALIVTAIAFYQCPALTGGLIGLAAGWMPACLGLIALWTGFYRRQGGIRFLAVAMTVVILCGSLAWAVPELAIWARAIGSRTVGEAGLWNSAETRTNGSFWKGIDLAYRLPVLIAYFFLVMITTIWPLEKNLGELIALSAALLVASQFWYLDEGGTLVLLYLPLIILMMFRPNLSMKRPICPSESRPRRSREFLDTARLS